VVFSSTKYPFAIADLILSLLIGVLQTLDEEDEDEDEEDEDEEDEDEDEDDDDDEDEDESTLINTGSLSSSTIKL